VLDDGSAVVKNFAFNSSSKMVVTGRKFLTVGNIHSYPIVSSVLVAYHVKYFSSLQSWPFHSVFKKLYRMPFKSGFAVVPLLHAEKAVLL